jgi:hypothetical protein
LKIKFLLKGLRFGNDQHNQYNHHKDILMRRLTVYETSDGIRHDSLEKGRKHADERFGAALLSLSKQLVQIDKYTAMTEFLENNLEDFLNLQRLKEDTSLNE